MVDAIFFLAYHSPNFVLELYEIHPFAPIYLLCVMSCRWRVISFSLSIFVDEGKQNNSMTRVILYLLPFFV